MKSKFLLLNKLATQMSSSLCFNKAQASLYDYIRGATLGWNRYGREVSLQDMLKSNAKMQLPKISVSLPRLYAARRAMLDMSIIIQHKDSYYLNCPFIIRTAFYSYGDTLKDAPEFEQELRSLYEIVRQDFIDNDILQEVKELPTSEEIFNNIPAKKKSKRFDKPNPVMAEVPPTILTMTSLFSKFVQIYRENGVKVYGYLLESDPPTMRQELGSLKGFLSKYKDRHNELLTFLRDSASYWTYICKEAERDGKHGFIFGHADIIVVYMNHDYIKKILSRKHLQVVEEGRGYENVVISRD